MGCLIFLCKNFFQTFLSVRLDKFVQFMIQLYSIKINLNQRVYFNLKEEELKYMRFI